jgi:hypothetical protein
MCDEDKNTDEASVRVWNHRELLPVDVRIGRTNIICLCGSTKFEGYFHQVNRTLSLMGNIVISLGVFGHGDQQNWDNHIDRFGLPAMPTVDWGTDDNPSEAKVMLDQLHFRKIDLANMVYVVNPNRYIGTSTQREVEYALSQGKQVSLMIENKDLCSDCWNDGVVDKPCKNTTCVNYARTKDFIQGV